MQTSLWALMLALLSLGFILLMKTTSAVFFIAIILGTTGLLLALTQLRRSRNFATVAFLIGSIALLALAGYIALTVAMMN